MFEKPTIVGVSQRVVATLVACALVMASAMYYTTAQAANLTNVSDTLGTSAPSVTSAHTIAFTIPTGSALADGDTVTITFETGFTGIAGVADANTDISVNGTVDTDGSATVAGAGQSITFDTVAASAGDEVVVAIADGIITNPAGIQSYTIDIDTGTGGDSAQTRVAIVDTVTVTAIVETTFDFSITGVATSSTVNGESTTGSTTASAVPFHILTADVAKVMAQQLNVSTNARNGFVVTVEQDGEFQSSTGAIIDSFTDGTYVDTPTAWAVPGDSITDDTTWGHWGITSTDADLNANEFNVGTGGDRYIAASTTPRIIFSHASSSDGLTNNIGSTTVGYKIEVTPLQEAGDDYQTILTYIATPTF